MTSVKVQNAIKMIEEKCKKVAEEDCKNKGKCAVPFTNINYPSNTDFAVIYDINTKIQGDDRIISYSYRCEWCCEECPKRKEMDKAGSDKKDKSKKKRLY